MRFMMIAFILLTSCTGQTIMAPMNVQTRSGAVLVHSAPIFRNSGNLVNVTYHYEGNGGTVDFHAEQIDNGEPTLSMWAGLTKFARSIVQPIVFATTGAAGLPALAHAAH